MVDHFKMWEPQEERVAYQLESQQMPEWCLLDSGEVIKDFTIPGMLQFSSVILSIAGPNSKASPHPPLELQPLNSPQGNYIGAQKGSKQHQVNVTVD